MNRKGQVDSGYESTGNAIHAITLLLIATVMALSLVFLASDYLSKNISPEEKTEKFLLIESVKNCFVFEENDRVHYDTINPLLINDSFLESCVPENDVAVMLKDIDENIIYSATTASYLNIETEGYVYNVNLPDSNELFKMVVILG